MSEINPRNGHQYFLHKLSKKSQFRSVRTKYQWNHIYSTFLQTFSVEAVDGDTQVDPPSPIEYNIKFISSDEQRKYPKCLKKYCTKNTFQYQKESF